jgi:HAD superfamily hydrolase (TIGR01509 family)
MIETLLLDFDGLIVDTETTDFESWRLVYQEHGAELPRDDWVAAIGTDGSAFDPLSVLQGLVGRRLEAEDVRARRRAHREELFDSLEPLPGVLDWLEAATERGISVSIVSSSPRWWVEQHLGRVGLRDPFRFLTTADDVERVKPHPDPYQHSLRLHGCRPSAAVAVEDSPAGLSAAKAAGLFCVAVPGPMTRGLAFADADLQLDSLAERSLGSVIELAARQ